MALRMSYFVYISLKKMLKLFGVWDLKDKECHFSNVLTN